MSRLENQRLPHFSTLIRLCVFVTFSLSTNRLIADWTVQFANTTYGFYGISFVDTLHGWVVGGGLCHGPGKVLRTIDGGRNWEWIYETEQILVGVFFVDTLYGWAVGDSGTIIHTRDGGISWTLQTSGTSARLRKVVFVNRDTGWVVGWPGIFHTTDGGNTWLQQLEAVSYDLSFVDIRNGWVAGGEIFYTSDGGASWEAQETGVPGSPRTYQSVFFVDTLNGWATAWSFYNSGDSYWLLHTSNGGNNWEIQDSTIGGGDIYFVNSNIGWTICGSSIYHTINGGKTWNCEYSIPMIFLELSFVDSLHGWAVAYYPLVDNEAEGMILHYSPSVGVKEKTNLESTCFRISPNPIYSVALITFYTESASRVCLKVYDSLGRLVNTLIDGYVSRGKQQVTWQPQGGSGVYFLKFEEGNQTMIKKVVVLSSHVKRR